MKFPNVRRLGGQQPGKPIKKIWQMHVYMELAPLTLAPGQRAVQSVAVKNFHREQSYDLLITSRCTCGLLTYGETPTWDPPRVTVEPASSLTPAAETTVTLPAETPASSLPGVDQVQVSLIAYPVRSTGKADAVNKTHHVVLHPRA